MVLVLSPNGTKTKKASLSIASTSADCIGKTIIVTTPQTVDDVTIPATIALRIEKGGLITVNSGKSLIVNGPFEAGVYQCFADTGAVTFGTAMTVRPEWWGAVDSAAYTFDSAPAFRSAAASIVSKGGTVYFTGKYMWDSTGVEGTGLSITDGVNLEGVSRSITEIRIGTSFPAAIAIGCGGLTTKVVRIKNFSLVNAMIGGGAGVASAATSGLHLDNIASSIIEGVGVSRVETGTGMFLTATGPSTTYFNQFKNCFIEFNKYGLAIQGGTTNAPNATTIIGGEIVGKAGVSKWGLSLIDGSATYLDGTYMLGTSIENRFDFDAQSAGIHVSSTLGVHTLYPRTEMVASKVLNLSSTSSRVFYHCINNGANQLRRLDLVAGSNWPSAMLTARTFSVSLSTSEAYYPVTMDSQVTNVTFFVTTVSAARPVLLLPASYEMRPGTRLTFIHAADNQPFTLRTVEGDHLGDRYASKLLSILPMNSITIESTTATWKIVEGGKYQSNSTPVGKGVFLREQRVYVSAVNAGGSDGFACVSREDDYVSATALAAATTVNVTSSTGMLAGDNVSLIMDNGNLHATTIATVPGGTSITITAAVPAGRYIPTFYAVSTAVTTTVSTSATSTVTSPVTALTVGTTVGMTAGDAISVTLDNYAIHTTTIASVTTPTALVLTAALPTGRFVPATMQTIYTNRFKALANIAA